MKKISIKSGDITVTIRDNKYTVEQKNNVWKTKRAPYLKLADGRTVDFPPPCELTRFHSGTAEVVKAVYRGFDKSDIYAVAHIGIDRTTKDVFFNINIQGDRQGELELVSFPPPFEFGAEKGHGYTVLSRMQGTLIPAGQPITVETGLVFQRDAYMPIYGQVKDGAGYTAIFETPYDAKYQPEGDRIAPLWMTSLGRMSYTRKMRFCFRESCDHNVIAKCYRDYVKERGGLITLKQKIAKNENVKRLIGCPVIHTGIAVHTAPESMFYDKEHPENNDTYVSFDTRAKQLKRLKKLGLKRAYTHFDGWGFHGYDNLHPSPFPPHEGAGGADGMRRLSETCRKLNYIFGIHDQYRDYYYDNPDFSFDEALVYQDGSHPFHDVWNGGKHTFLCSELAPDYVRRNYDRFKELGIRIDASYLDVFSVVELDECFNEDHMCTRRDCAENRKHCLEILTERGIIPSSEEVLDCILPSQVLCHHAPFFTEVLGAEDSDPVGVPIPLLELVYHDCIVVPWIGLPAKRGGWGIPKNDSAYLYAVLYGCPVYCPIDATEQDIKDVLLACESAERLAHTELVKHEFIDGDIRRQRTAFSDGTVIEADLDKGTFDIYHNKTE